MAYPEHLIANPPKPLTRPSLNRLYEQAGSEAEVELNELERLRVGLMRDMLWHPELTEFMRDGKLTVAGIKPRIEESNIGATHDNDGEKMLMKLIEEELDIVFSVSFIMTEADLMRFYGDGLIKRLKTKVSQDGRMVWDVFSEYMRSGPVTFMLLYSEDGKAVEKWRAMMGPLDLEDARTNHPESIRGKFAVRTENNLVHGSSGDTPSERRENVSQEVDWIRNKLDAVLIDATRLATGEDRENYYATLSLE